MCWKCGRVGHKAVACRQVGAVEQDEADEEEADEEVTVRNVGVVEVMGKPEAETINKVVRSGKKSDYDKGKFAIDVGAVKTMNVDDGIQGDDWQVKAPKKKFVKVTLDSGAGASCWPEKLWKAIPMNPKTKGVKFAAANGTELKYYGNKDVRFVPRDKLSKSGVKVQGGMCEMKFHVTDTTKPLASALAVVKMGNRIVLDGDLSYIENKATGEKVSLKESGGTYVFEVEAVPNATNNVAGFARRG
jgi:hypothetical protein